MGCVCGDAGVIADQRETVCYIRRNVRKALFRIHQYLAATVGFFVLIFGITGSIMAFGPELDALLHASRSMRRYRIRSACLVNHCSSELG